MLSRPALPSSSRTIGYDVTGRLLPAGLVVVGGLAALICAWAMTGGSWHKMLIFPILALSLYIILVHTTLAPFLLILVGASSFMSAYSLPSDCPFLTGRAGWSGSRSSCSRSRTRAASGGGWECS